VSNDPREDSTGGTGEQVGSVSEEAAKLFGALSDWAREHGPDLGEAGEGSGLAGLAGRAASAVQEVSDHVDTGAPECAWCPVCRTVHLVRATSPEVRDHLASAAASFLQAAAGILAAAANPQERTQPGVEHIDLDDDLDGDWPEEET
jgi:hypothetical protein